MAMHTHYSIMCVIFDIQVLSENCLRSKGAESITRMLLENSTIHTLDLSGMCNYKINIGYCTKQLIVNVLGHGVC